ncbi:MAG: TOBE domain-containing protein, partial [Planktomarina sp.]
INVFPTTVEGALVQTPFGQFLAPGYEDGTELDIVVRPQHIRIDFDRAGKGPTPTPAMGNAAHATVERARFLGHHTMVDFTLDAGPSVTASVPSVFLPQKGTPFWLLAPRKHCYVFPRSVKDAR